MLQKWKSFKMHALWSVRGIECVLFPGTYFLLLLIWLNSNIFLKLVLSKYYSINTSFDASICFNEQWVTNIWRNSIFLKKQPNYDILYLLIFYKYNPNVKLRMLKMRQKMLLRKYVVFFMYLDLNYLLVRSYISLCCKTLYISEN